MARFLHLSLIFAVAFLLLSLSFPVNGSNGQLRCELKNTDLFGSDLGGISDVPDWTTCGQLCSYNPDCGSFSWNYNLRLCLLKKGVPDPAEREGWNSGTLSCFKSSSCELSNIDLPGSDLVPGFSVPSWFACGVSCSRFPGCGSFTWNSITASCHIKKGIPDQSAYKGGYSGTASCFNATTSYSQRMENG